MSDVCTQQHTRGTSNVQSMSCGSEENNLSEAIDLLAVWVLEDVDAVAKSFGVRLTTLLDELQDRVRAEAPLFELGNTEPGDSQPGSSGR